ncbi:MAG: PAS-domain containing protein [Hyphomicrobiales bacterium]|jgi:signal transduction histidine kinase
MGGQNRMGQTGMGKAGQHSDAVTLRSATLLATTAGSTVLFTQSVASPAFAQGVPDPNLVPHTHGIDSLIDAPMLAIGGAAITGLSLFVGVMLISAFVSLRRARRKASENETNLARLRAQLDMTQGLVDTSGDGLLMLSETGASTVLHCPTDQSAMPEHPDDLPNFDRWIEDGDLPELDAAIDQLRQTGKRIDLDVRTKGGTLINVHGRPIGARLIVRLRDLSRLQRDFADALHLCANLEAESDHLKQLLNAVDFPVWTADQVGLVSWSNDAFKKRGVKSAADGIVSARSVVGSKTQWGNVDGIHADGARIADSLPADAGQASEGDRLVHLRSTTKAGTVITAGYAMPLSDQTRYEQALQNVHAIQGRMLNALNTAVCVFNAERHVAFYNAAFAELFGFQRRVLDEHPHESTVLTYIKSTRQMPESGNHRGWREQFTSAYTASEPITDDWELHDGRFLRVITAPNADGGAIWLFENETEKVELKSRFTALTQVRAATLDALREGVAVFGSNGRLQLVNPAFGQLWQLAPDEAKIGAHVKDITGPIRDLARDRRVIDQLVGLVGSLGQRREGIISRMNLTDERVIDLVATPLPGGATMLTANDVTASVGIEDTLRESNAALEEAARIKTTFIKHVSYELRSPLTSIIGFAQLLDDKETGPLNERQRDYLNFVLSSTQSLVALVDSILDLATVDAGILTLSLDTISPMKLIEDAELGLRDRLLDADITIDHVLDPKVATLVVDETRMRQVLYNLLSNAVASSRPGNKVRVKTRLDDGGKNGRVVVSVIDQGRGMSAAQAKAAFEPFETGQNTVGTGAGLGLTLSRALVELHGGTMQLWSREGIGTVVRCVLPLDPEEMTPLDQAAQ